MDSELGLLDRTPFGWLRERDVDLLLCSELHCRGALTNYFAHRLSVPAARFGGAWVSESDTDGETDLLLVFEGETGHVVALIENKIAAVFQPDQAKRYGLRRDRWSRHERVSHAVTVLVAPESYATRQEATQFDLIITYEQIATVLRDEQDTRSQFFLSSLTAGIDASRRGYVLVPDAVVSALHRDICEIARRTTPRLNVRLSEDKPKGSDWIYFKDADGFEQTHWRTAVVVYKAERGQVDLQFGSTIQAELARRTAATRTASMKVESAGKSASLRLKVPKIDFDRPVPEQETAVIEGLAACEEMRAFFVQHRSSLLPPSLD